MNKKALREYFAAVFIYGTIGYFLHFINASSEFVVLCRGTLGSLFILFVILISKQSFHLQDIKKNLKYLLISGISLGLNWVFLFAGYKISVSLSSLCNYTAPIIVVIITSLMTKEKLSLKQIICVITSFIGIILISGILDKNSTIDYRAIVYGLLAAACFVVLVLCNRNLQEIKPLEKTFVQLLVSALTVLPFVIMRDGFPTNLDSRSIVLLLLLGFLHTGIAYIFYFDSISKLEPIKIAIVGYVEPVLATIIGVVLLKETVNVYIVVGAILIIGSAIASEILNNDL